MAGEQAAARETTLGEVVRHWGDEYEIRAGTAYHATRGDGTGKPLKGATPGELMDLIAADHASREAGGR